MRVPGLWVGALAALAIAACTEGSGAPEAAGIHGCSRTNVSAQGIETCSNVLARTDLGPEERIRALFERGSLHRLLGDSGQARADFQAIRALDPRSPLAPRGLASLARDAEDFPEALRLYDEALRLDPGDPTLVGLRGIILYRLDRHREAFQSLSDALGSDTLEPPVRPGLVFYRGAAAVELGQGAVAVADFEEYQRLDPTYEHADFWMGRALAVAGRHREAAARLGADIDRRPNHSWPSRAYRGLAFVDLNDFDAAIAELDDAVDKGVPLGWLRGHLADRLDVHLGPANASYREGIRHALRVLADVHRRYASEQRQTDRQNELFPPRIFRDPGFLFALKTGMAPLGLHKASDDQRMASNYYFGVLINKLHEMPDPTCQAIVHDMDRLVVGLATTGDVLGLLGRMAEEQSGAAILGGIVFALFGAAVIEERASSDARMLAARHGCHSDVVIGIVEHGSTYVQWSMRM